jgi:hypothetical protein
VCVEKNVRGRFKIDKTFSAKSFSGKVFDGRDFFQNYNYKKIFKILKNIILDFSFSKKQ